MSRREKRDRPDAEVVPYQQIRDRFLSRSPSKQFEKLKLYAEIGRFILDRWEAEALDQPPNGEFDEMAGWDRWDLCTEKHLRDIRTEANALVEEQITKRRITTLVREWAKDEGAGKIGLKIGRWLTEEALGGFVGGIGLLGFGLLLVWASPHIAKSLRGTVDDMLPASTKPG